MLSQSLLLASVLSFSLMIQAAPVRDSDWLSTSYIPVKDNSNLANLLLPSYIPVKSNRPIQIRDSSKDSSTKSDLYTFKDLDQIFRLPLDSDGRVIGLNLKRYSLEDLLRTSYIPVDANGNIV